MIELGLYIILFIADGVAIKTTEIREIRFGLKRDGSLIDTKNIPQCGSHKIIHLVSYKYQLLQCFYDSYFCSSVHEEPLLPDEKFHLHQMCSLQRQCRNLSFPHRAEAQRNKAPSIIIRYECIGKKRLVNICRKTERTFNTSVYLTSVRMKGPFTECPCFVNSKRFSISVTDIRLNDNLKNECSPAVLHISEVEFKCDETRKDYGAIFSKSPWDSLSNAYISLVQNSNTSFPDMVLMILQPESSLRLICEGQETTRIINANRSTLVERSSISASEQPPTTTVRANYDVSKTVTNGHQEDTYGKFRTMAITLAATIVVLCMCFVYFDG